MVEYRLYRYCGANFSVLISFFILIKNIDIWKSRLQAEWAKKKLVWVPHESTGYVAASMKRQQGEEVEVEIVETGKRKMVAKAGYSSSTLIEFKNRKYFVHILRKIKRIIGR